MSNAFIRLCKSCVKVRLRALLIEGAPRIIRDLHTPFSFTGIIFNFPPGSESIDIYSRSALDILLENFSYYLDTILSEIYINFIQLFFFFLTYLLQDRVGDTSRRGWLFQVYHVRCELYGGNFKRDQRCRPELADEGLFAWLGVQFYRHTLRDGGDRGKDKKADRSQKKKTEIDNSERIRSDRDKK